MIPGKELTPELLSHLAETVNADENPVNYLSIDPGKANGVCGYDCKAYLVFMYTINEKDMIDFLHQFKCIKTCIIENYILYPHKARDQIYSDMGTSRVIGRVETWSKLLNIELIKQPAAIKNTAYKWIGEKPPTKSDKHNHEKDAHVHFVYWAVRTGLMDLSSLVKRGK